MKVDPARSDDVNDFVQKGLLGSVNGSVGGNISDDSGASITE